MSLLGNTKAKIIEIEKSGIYQIHYEDYDKCYIGQIRRNIGKDLKNTLEA